MPEAWHLVIMLKRPVAGRVKTRLGRDIGMTTAAWWFRHQSAALIRGLRDPRWSLTLAISPDHMVNSPVWPIDLPRIPQGRGDLGQRMERVFRTMPKGRVCIIGGDIPGVRRHHINKAFRALGPNKAVFGPATDGGFWLVGLSRNGPHPIRMFQNVRWSTQHALADSLQNLNGLSVGHIDMLQDVDTVKDLQRLTFSQ